MKGLPIMNSFIALSVPSNDLSNSSSSSYFENYSSNSSFSIRESFNPQKYRKSSTLIHVHLEGKEINIRKETQKKSNNSDNNEHDENKNDNSDNNNNNSIESGENNVSEYWFVQKKGLKGLKGID